MYNNNAVYNFDVFTQEKVQKQTKIFELPSINSRREKKHKEKLKFYARCLSLILGTGIVIGGFLFGQAKLVEYNAKASSESLVLEEMKIRNKQLEMKLNSINGEKNLNKSENNEFVETISISSGDKSKIY